MATDFRISSAGGFKMGVPSWKQILAAFQLVIIINQAVGLSVWMPQFLSGGHGRNIRHLPCVSRRTGEQGTCMFAYTCMKSNGTHLGTCIDRFYFGSCCKLKDGPNDLLLESHLNVPVINSNQVSSSFLPDESKISSDQTTSLPNLTNNKFTLSSAAGGFPFASTSVRVESTSQFSVPSDKTEINSSRYPGTVSPSTTDKVYIPIHTSQTPNKTEQMTSSSGTLTTHGSSSSILGEMKRPTTPNQTFIQLPHLSFTTQSYFLSTFQVVHNENENAANKTVSTKGPPVRPTTEPVTAWTPIRPVTTLGSILKKNATTEHAYKPATTTTTKKPLKPVKTVTTTRKPPSKKPTSKPIVKPIPTTSQPAKVTTPAKKPIPTVNRVTTQKPTPPPKKPTQPIKKPVISSTKPTTLKPVPTLKPPSLTSKPTSINVPLHSTKVTTAKPSTTAKATTSTASPQTTPETVFTAIASMLSSAPTSHYGITTFRPDLMSTTKKPPLITGPYLTTFNYTSEGVKVTSNRPALETTQSTVSNEVSSPTYVESIPEAQEENTNVIFQQSGSASSPDPTSLPPLTKQNDTTVPFFPEAAKPDSGKPPWIQIVQSTSPETGVSTTAKPTTTTTTRTYTMAPVFAGINTSDYTQVCGRRMFPESRVVGGEKSTFGKWPWQISLRQWRTSTYLHKCGAALLNENWAITAAHCVENVPPSDLLLRLGEHDLSTEDEPYGFQERRVQIVASHPQFDPRTFEYDLALLRFYEPVKFQPNIIPVCVPEDGTNFVGQTAYVTGWGRLYEDGPLPSVLQEVSVPVINNTLCENMYRSAGYIEHIPEIFICAGWKKGGFDSCEGDSGGPMVIQRPDKRWLLAGVISWGIGCAEPNQPGVYTRISEFRDWIHQILQF